MNYRYMKATKENYLIRDTVDKGVQRYDFERGEWVLDFTMAQIYFGEIPVDVISKENADKIISDFKAKKTTMLINMQFN